MKRSAILDSLAAMTSGECRFVGRVDIHVYCWAPCDLVDMPTGRKGWQRRPPKYKVFTGDDESHPWEPGGWLEPEEAAARVATLLKEDA